MVLQALYYLWLPTGVLLDPLLWKVLTILLNGGMIALIFRDRFGYGIDSELRPLFEAMRVLNPGQFRRLVKGTARIAGPMPILALGVRPDALYYVLHGEAEITKDARRLRVGAGTFLGEIAFISGGVATADVAVIEGGLALAWNVAELKALMARDKHIDIALRGLLSHDLAAKTAQSRLPVQAMAG
jgi:CRP-like cAMP-binding protein